MEWGRKGEEGKEEEALSLCVCLRERETEGKRMREMTPGRKKGDRAASNIQPTRGTLYSSTLPQGRVAPNKCMSRRGFFALHSHHRKKQAATMIVPKRGHIHPHPVRANHSSLLFPLRYSNIERDEEAEIPPLLVLAREPT